MEEVESGAVGNAARVDRRSPEEDWGEETGGMVAVVAVAVEEPEV